MIGVSDDLCLTDLSQGELLQNSADVWQPIENHVLLLALNRAAQAVRGAHTLENVCCTIADEIRSAGYHALFFELSGDREYLTLSFTTLEPLWFEGIEKLPEFTLPGYRFSPAHGGLLREIITEEKSAYCKNTSDIIVEDIAGLGQTLIGELVTMLGIRKSIYSPLRVNGRLNGLLGVAGTRLAQADVPLVIAFANQVSIAMENVCLLGQLRASRERLRCQARQIVSTQEEDRRRWSRTLHDEAGQALTSLKISLELVAADLPPDSDSLQRRVVDAVNLTAKTMEQIRLMARDLHPPVLDIMGLNIALSGFCHDFAQRTGLSISYCGLELPQLSQSVEICLYRFLQEALTNVAKHAAAHEIRVKLCHDAETISLSVRDDGRGFDTQARLCNSSLSMGIGLLGMRERLELLDGCLRIESQSGRGTHLAAFLPSGESP